eukprot:scaffold29132_cov17-Tisochrysis_lutea.AAC.1
MHTLVSKAGLDHAKNLKDHGALYLQPFHLRGRQAPHVPAVLDDLPTSPAAISNAEVVCATSCVARHKSKQAVQGSKNLSVQAAAKSAATRVL